MTGKDQRRFVRRPVNIAVKFVVQGRSYQGWIKNISEGGVFIETGKPFPVGKIISMTYPSPNYENKHRTGMITWTNPKGFGVKFTEPEKTV